MKAAIKISKRLRSLLESADAKDWSTVWSDIALIDKHWQSLPLKPPPPGYPSRLIGSWPLPLPPQWDHHCVEEDVGSGPTGQSTRLPAASFSALLDRLIDEILEDAIRRQAEWIALVPREQNADGVREVVEHFHPQRVQDQWVPWQWWRGFLSRLEQRLGLPVNGGQSAQEEAMKLSVKIPDLSTDLSLGRKKTVSFRARILIERVPASAEGCCVIFLS